MPKSVREIYTAWRDWTDNISKYPEEYYGRMITAACISPLKNGNAVALTFSDGVTIHIFDYCALTLAGGTQYLSCDDDLSTLVGGNLISLEVSASSITPHLECAFLKIQAQTGCVTVANYNDHDGSYGGFSMRIWEV